MKSKFYLGNGSKVLFGDTRFTRENKLSCKEAVISIKERSINIDAGSHLVECDIDELGLDEDEDGFFYEIDL
jgi:hypothetical protein